VKKLRPSERRAQKLGEREQAVGLDSDDDAARWLAEHEPKPQLTPPKSAGKSKTLHRWRQGRARPS
jgi:hypothetical protein